MKKLMGFVILAGICLGSFGAQAAGPYLVQQPTVSRTQVVFVYADDLWVVSRDGGNARRLTTGVGIERNPYFSPDGRQVAFTGNYDGNMDVFVVDVAGGVPQRLTYHPGRDSVRGWTPDGKRVLFMSTRSRYSRYTRLYTVSLEGGMPEEIPLPYAVTGSFSPDGSHMAYDHAGGAYQTWKRYRGGRMSKIWVADLSDSSVEFVPREKSNDFNPMWVGDTVYFLSDREGTVKLFSYDTGSKAVRRALDNSGFDIKSASSGPGAIVYEKFGSLHLFDTGSRRSREIRIEIAGDLPSVRPHFTSVSSQIRSADLSPTGQRAVFGARGEVLTVPAKKGSIRNLTNSPAEHDRFPAWSPDGKWIAYFSDKSGEYALYLTEQSGIGETRTITLGSPPSFFYDPVWSPDSKKIAYTDKRLNVWFVNLEDGKLTKVDTDTYDAPFRTLDPVWSPDSRWLAYTRQLKSQLHAVFVFDTAAGEKHQLTDGLSDARHASFDKDGKYLFFTASTNFGPTTSWLDMFSVGRSVSSSAYVVVLRKGDPSPLAPESDDEKVKEEKEEGEAEESKKSGDAKKKEKKEVEVQIDFEGISQRILALPVPTRNYTDLQTGKAGHVFLLAGSAGPGFGSQGQTLYQFDLKKRKEEKFLDRVNGFTLSADGEKLLYVSRDRWAIVGTASPPKSNDGRLNLSNMQVWVDPKAEWGQIYREVWRIERDFLYDPNAHGLNLQRAERSYESFLQNLGSRRDLNYLLSEMLGNLVLGHTRNGGGDLPRPSRVPGGLLGADYEVADGRYRFARIFQGENWNPRLRAPLTEPGVDVNEGDYLIEVNGNQVRGTDNVYRFLENTSGKQVVIKVSSSSDGSNARISTVVPIGSEFTLRHRAWTDDNRRKVEQLSNGRVGYVYLPNTGGGGYTNFNRYYFAHVGKEGVVFDERFNGGGLVANYIVDTLNRPLASMWSTREGEDFATPANGIFGPKVMLINEWAGSGGDWMPWYFRFSKAGKLIGKTTWGGLVGVYGYPVLMDGGSATAPRLAFWNPHTRGWEIENAGVPPDIDIEFDPKAWREGRDPQLERGVQEILDELRRNPLPKYTKPAFPNYYRRQRQP